MNFYLHNNEPIYTFSLVGKRQTNFFLCDTKDIVPLEIIFGNEFTSYIGFRMKQFNDHIFLVFKKILILQSVTILFFILNDIQPCL